MLYPIPSHLSDLPIYKKAMEIIILSRSISTYLNNDLSYLKPDGSEDENIYFSEILILQILSLLNTLKTLIIIIAGIIYSFKQTLIRF